MTEPTIAAGYPRALFEFAVSRGVDRDDLIRQSGIRPANLKDQDARIPLDTYLSLMDHCIVLCKEPALALLFGAAVQMPQVSIVGLIGAAAATVEEAGRQLNRYSRLIMDAGSIGTPIGLKVVRDSTGVWLELASKIYIDHPHLTEVALAQGVCGARSLLANTDYFQRKVFPRALHFTHAQPAYRDRYDRIFGVPLVFGSKRNAILVDEEFVAIKMSQTNRYVFGVLSERAEALLKSLENAKTVRGRVESLLIPHLHTGETNMAWASSKLGLSRQTLFRKLKEEGVTFEVVLDELRRKMASHYLDAKQTSVNQTAYLVGFSDPSAFSRAFKRWTGSSPGKRPASTAKSGNRAKVPNSRRRQRSKAT